MPTLNQPSGRVVITGSGVLTALGDSPTFLHGALCEGRSALHPVETNGDGRMPSVKAGDLRRFEPKGYLTEGNLRPLDRTGRLTATAAKLALGESGWDAEMLAENEMGLVLGTMFGSVHTISEFDRRALVAGPNYAKPMDFANSVINAAAGQTAIWHNLRGINATVSAGLASGLQALAYGADLIRSGKATALLAGGADEFCFESLYGFYRGGLLYDASNGGGYPIPFDRRRNGFALGEAAALLVLEDLDTARARGARIIAEIRGHGASYDCSRGRDAERAISCVARSIQLALDDAGVTVDAIDCLSASANGSVTGDLYEARGVEAVFNSRAARLPATAVKSMLGETLGASGALQTISQIESMRSGLLPGVLGLESFDEGFPLTQASPECRMLDMERGLVSAVGFDGKVCSLVVELWDRGKSLERGSPARRRK